MDGVEVEGVKLRHKRVPKACDVCCRRKTRCDGQTPCDPCVRFGAISGCVYSLSVRRRGRKPHITPSAPSLLASRCVSPLNSILDSHSTSYSNPNLSSFLHSHPEPFSAQSPASSDLPSLSTSVDTDIFPSAYEGSEPVQPATDFPIASSLPVAVGDFDDVSASTPSLPFLPSIFLPTSLADSALGPLPRAFVPAVLLNHFVDADHLAHANFAFLPFGALAELIGAFFVYIYPQLPIIHPSHFLRNFASQSQLLLNAVFANAVRYCKHISLVSTARSYLTNQSENIKGDRFLWKAGDFFYKRCRELSIDARHTQPPTLQTVQAYILMQAYAAQSGRIADSWVIRAKVTTLAKTLSLNTEALADALTYGNAEREVRRRVWYSMYSFERNGRPMGDRWALIKNSDCQVYLPSNELEFITASEVSTRWFPSTAQILELQYLRSDFTWVPSLKFTNHTAALALYNKMMVCVLDFAERNLANENAKRDLHRRGLPAALPEADEALDEELQLIHESLLSFQISFPEYFKSVPTSYSPELSAQMPYLVGRIVSNYYCTMIYLDYTRLSQFRIQRQSAAWESGISSARVISDIARVIGATNPQIHYMSSSYNIPLLFSAWVLVALLITTNNAKTRLDTIKRINWVIGCTHGARQYTATGSDFHDGLMAFLSGSFFKSFENMESLEPRWSLMWSLVGQSQTIHEDLAVRLDALDTVDEDLGPFLMYRTFSSFFAMRAAQISMFTVK